MSCGVLCVANDVGDTRDIIGDCGEVVYPGQPDQMVQSSEKLLALSNAEKVEASKKARERILEHYSLETMIRAYTDLYEKL